MGILSAAAKAAVKKASSFAVKPAKAAAKKASLAVERAAQPYFAPGSLERAANLARAMEGSSVTDPVFHGSYDDIPSFDPGTHFGTSAAAAQRLADMVDLREGAPNISRVHLSAKNPFRVTDAEASDDATFLKAIAKGKYPDLDLNTARRKGGLRAVKDAGYDALVYRNRMEDAGRDSYVTTSRGQVKSAIGNRGTFNMNDPDLNKAHGGRVSSLAVKRKGKK